MHLARFSAVPTPSKNVVSRFKAARHNHGVLPQQGLRLPFPSPQQGHLDSPASRHSHRPPSAALRIGSLLQIPLVKLHPRFVRVVKGSDHGEVGGKLEDIFGETLLSAYMQKTCDVAEKAILAEKNLRKKCVNRDKMKIATKVRKSLKSIKMVKIDKKMVKIDKKW